MLVVCTVAMAVLFLMPPMLFAVTVWGTVRDPNSLSLLAMVACILILSSCLKEAGALEELVGAVRNALVDNRFTIGLLPSLIGLLPMPGGALFSAPMIEGLADEAKLSAETRTYLNYWFRHVWEYSYPLYPGLLLAATILDIDLREFVVYQFPLCLAALLGGSIFGLLQVPKLFRPIPGGGEFWRNIRTFLNGFWPVLLIILVVIVIPWPEFIEENVNLLLVTLPVTIILFGLQRLGWGRLVKTVRTSIDWRLILVILAVLIFKDIIAESGAVEELPGVLGEWGIPPVALFIVLPMLVGYLTGITHSYVSVAFPLLLPFFGDPVDLSKVQMAYAFGFIGVILSPVHLCLVLSSDYFQADMYKVIRKVYLPALVVALISIVMYLA